MKREIKFRAWDESQKYMAIQGTPDLETLHSFMFHFGDKILMQFTGLKDVNGVEIYEGDIVRWGMLNKQSYEVWHRYAVLEINPDITFRILYYIVDKTGERKDGDNYVFHYGNFAYKETHKHLEVIGNIYENNLI